MKILNYITNNEGNTRPSDVVIAIQHDSEGASDEVLGVLRALAMTSRRALAPAIFDPEDENPEQDGEREEYLKIVPKGNYLFDINGKVTIFHVSISRKGHQRIKGFNGWPASKLRFLANSELNEAARQYGIRTGRCCKCNRLLTDKTSVLLGIGPKCGFKVHAAYYEKEASFCFSK